jgi:hypothetical protein
VIWEKNRVIKRACKIGTIREMFEDETLKQLSCDPFLPHNYEDVSRKIKKAVIQSNIFTNMVTGLLGT